MELMLVIDPTAVCDLADSIKIKWISRPIYVSVIGDQLIADFDRRSLILLSNFTRSQIAAQKSEFSDQMLGHGHRHQTSAAAASLPHSRLNRLHLLPCTDVSVLSNLAGHAFARP
jgi:hypothetical protein